MSASTNRISLCQDRGIRACGATKAERIIDFRLVNDAKLDRIDLQLVGEFIHRRFGCVKSRHRAWSSHGSGRTDVAACTPEVHTQVGNAVKKCRGLATILVIIIEDCLEDVIVLKRNQFPFGGCAQPHALLCPWSMSHRLKHHLPADDNLYGLSKLPGGCDASGQWVHGHNLLPKPDPRNFVTTRTFSCGKPNICARTFRVLNMDCVVS